MVDQSVVQFCHDMPKIELHAHLNTSFDSLILKELAERKAKTNKDINHLAMCISNYEEMEVSFQIFKLIHQIVDDEEAVYKLTVSVIRSFAADNVKYLELRSTPKEIPHTGMTRELYVRTMLRGIRDCQAENLDIVVFLLLSIDRRNSVEIAQLTVDLAAKFMQETDGLVLGIDFSGDPSMGNAEDFIPVFLSAKEKGLKVAGHLAEIANFKETLAVLQQSPPDRIGHGTFLHLYEPGQGHEEIEEIVLAKRIPIEACLTSNLKTKTVTEYSEHHFIFWFQKKHPVIICTDGTGVFMTSLSEEYAHAARTFNFSKQDLWHLSNASIDHTFAPERVKSKLREKWQKAFPHDM